MPHHTAVLTKEHVARTTEGRSAKGLQRLRFCVNRRVVDCQRYLPDWPALIESWQEDLAYVDAAIERLNQKESS